MNGQQIDRRSVTMGASRYPLGRSLGIALAAMLVCAATLPAGPAYATVDALPVDASALVEAAESAVGADDDVVPAGVEVVPRGETTLLEAADGSSALAVTVGAGDGADALYTADQLTANSTRFTAVLTAESGDRASWDFGDDAKLAALPDGRVVVSDVDGNLLAGIAAPWAIDAQGNHLETRFSVEGSLLTQHVEYAPDTAFPVVADPTVAVYPGYYQITLNRSESITATSSIAACAALFSKSPVPALKAAVIGCAVFAAYGTPQLANGKCLRINVVGLPPALSTWWPTWPQC